LPTIIPREEAKDLHCRVYIQIETGCPDVGHYSADMAEVIEIGNLGFT
jgi:hypothetical protein